MAKAKRSKISVSVLGTIILSFVHTVDAQQPAEVPRIAYLSPHSTSSAVNPFLQGLRDLGYFDGQNIVMCIATLTEKRVGFPNSRTSWAALKSTSSLPRAQQRPSPSRK